MTEILRFSAEKEILVIENWLGSLGVSEHSFETGLHELEIFDTPTHKIFRLVRKKTNTKKVGVDELKIDKKKWQSFILNYFNLQQKY